MLKKYLHLQSWKKFCFLISIAVLLNLIALFSHYHTHHFQFSLWIAHLKTILLIHLYFKSFITLDQIKYYPFFFFLDKITVYIYIKNFTSFWLFYCVFIYLLLLLFFYIQFSLLLAIYLFIFDFYFQESLWINL